MSRESSRQSSQAALLLERESSQVLSGQLEKEKPPLTNQLQGVDTWPQELECREPSSTANTSQRMYREAQPITSSSHQWVKDTPAQMQKQETLTIMHPLPAPYPPRPVPPNVNMSGSAAEASVGCVICHLTYTGIVGMPNSKLLVSGFEQV